MTSTRWHEFVDTRADAEQDRLALLEALFDPFTRHNLDRLGLAPGWRCLEVGAGAGSIARLLAERAGAGQVVATDLGTSALQALAPLGVRVLRHDVTSDPQPGHFDLIHARFVLDHLPERQTTLARMASWLRPGGWVLVEAGGPLPELSSHPGVRRSLQALSTVMARAIGSDATWARTLPRPLERAGLIGCQAEGLAIPVRGGSPMARWLRASTRLVQARALAAGVVSQAELEAAYDVYDDPDFVDYTWLTIAAWGRRGGA